MPLSYESRRCRLRVVEFPGGIRYVVFVGALVGQSTEYDPEKWYTWQFPRVAALDPGQAYDSAEDAETALRARNGASASSQGP